MNEKFIQNLDKLPADVRREFALLNQNLVLIFYLHGWLVKILN